MPEMDEKFKSPAANGRAYCTTRHQKYKND